MIVDTFLLTPLLNGAGSILRHDEAERKGRNGFSN
jgi:hypothetical protein